MFQNSWLIDCYKTDIQITPINHLNYRYNLLFINFGIQLLLMNRKWENESQSF